MSNRIAWGWGMVLATAAALGVGCGAAGSGSELPASFFEPAPPALDSGSSSTGTGLSGPGQPGGGTGADPLAATRAVCPAAAVTTGYGRLKLTLDGDVLFDFDKHRIKPTAVEVLTRLKGAVIDQHPRGKLIVEGHTDNVGSDEYNVKLSQRRADAVASWLASQGISTARIERHGYGEAFPRVPNTSDQNRAKNRRVEIVIIDNPQAKAPGPPNTESCDGVLACCELAKRKRGVSCVGKRVGPQGWGADLGRADLEDAGGVLRMTPCHTTRSAAIWVTSTNENMVAALDEHDGRELFRVPSRGRFPHRTAVARDGSVWVTNRESGSYVHLGADGKLLCSSPYGSCYTRAAAIDSKGFAWIGCHDTQELIKIHPTATKGTTEVHPLGEPRPPKQEGEENGVDDGYLAVPQCRELARVKLEHVKPYGLVADRSGTLWVARNEGNYIAQVDAIHDRVLREIDITADPAMKDQCWGPYGITIDRDGNPWYANWKCGTLVKIDHRTGKVIGVFGPPGQDKIRSARAAGLDRAGHIWVSDNEQPFVHEFASDGRYLKKVDLSSCANGLGALGTGSDSEGDMWTVLQNSDRVVQYRTDGTILGCYPDQTGVPPYARPYNYSDFTGSNRELVTGDQGRTIVRFTHPTAVGWMLAALRAVTPPRTSLCLRARAAATVEGLRQARWSEGYCPRSERVRTLTMDLSTNGKPLRGAALELEVELGTADPAVSALVFDLSVGATP